SVPVTETLFSSFNIFIVLTLLITLPLLNWILLKSKDPLSRAEIPAWRTENDEGDEKNNGSESEEKTPASRLENSQILSLLIGAMGLVYIVYHFVQNGFDLNLNIVIFIFLFAGIVLHRTPRRFLGEVENAAKSAGGIIIQFPFYAGIM